MLAGLVGRYELYFPDHLFAGWADGLQLFKLRLLMINRDNSVFWCRLAWLRHLQATRSSYWLSVSPTLYFVSVSGSLRDRRARQSYKVKYYGLALALQISAIILLEEFLQCWIIMEVWVYACHLSSVGGRSRQEAQDREMFAFLLCHLRGTTLKANLHCFLSGNNTDSPPLYTWHTIWNKFSCL